VTDGLMRKLRWPQFLASSVAFWCSLATIVVPSGAARAANSTFQITTFSNRPDKISGGDALVRIDVLTTCPSGSRPSAEVGPEPAGGVHEQTR
jgi:hypothetical protein